MIAIHRGSEILEIGVNQGSIRRFNLMKEDFIRLKFSLAENKPLLIGDYVDLTDYINSCDNEKFRINDENTDQTTKRFVLDRNYYPTFDKETGGWDYDVQINAYYHQWKNKIFMFNPSKGAAESSFSLTDTIDKHVELVVKNLASAEPKWDDNTDYSAFIQDEAKNKGMKVITYSSVSIYGALDMIAQTFECEWWMDGGYTIYFGYRKGDETTTLTLNDEIADASISDSDGIHATRIYAFGGTTNVPKHYRDKLEFKVNSYWFEGGAIKGVKDSTKPVLSSYFRGGKSKADERLLTISKATSSKGTSDIAAVTSTNVVSIEGQTYDVDLSNLKINFKATHLVGPEGESTGLIEVGKDINIRASVVATDGTNEDVIASEVKNIKIDRGTPTTSVAFTNSQRKFSFVPSSIEIRVEVISAKWKYTKHMGDENLVDGKWYDYKLVEFEFSNEQAVISFQKSAQSAETIIRINGGTKDYTAIINPNYKDGGSNILITDYTGAWEDIKTYTFPNIVISRVPSQYFSQEDGGVQNGVVQKNLMLPVGTNYVQADGVADANVVEAIMVYDWIYPKTALKVTKVEPFNEWKVEIEDGQTIDTTTYDITLPIEDYEDDLWVDPSQMFAIFQSGKAAGLRFELNYIKKTKDDVTFRLVPNEDYSITVPNEATIPAIDDEIILEGIDISFLSGSAITNAENELLTQANKNIVETSKEDKVVDITLASDYAYNKGRIALGTLTSLVDVLSSEDNAYDGRILGFEECLDIPWDKPKYIIGDKNYYNRQASIESKLENIEKGSITLSGVNIGGGGSNIPIIKVKDSTKPTDANVYSALRSREEFAKRKEEETFSEKVTFNKDIDVKGSTKTKSLSVSNDANIGGNQSVGGNQTINGTQEVKGVQTLHKGFKTPDFFHQGDIIQGAQVDADGNAAFTSITAPVMQIYELQYNRKTAVQEEFIFSDGDTIETVTYIQTDGTEIDSTVYNGEEYSYIRLGVRKQYEGYTTTFKDEDVLYSNVNIIGESGQPATTGKCWMRVLALNNGFGVEPISSDGLFINAILYSEAQCPGNVNIPPTPHMIVSRHGNTNGTKHPDRQSVFIVSTSGQNMVQLRGINSPIIPSEGAYGVVIGKLPQTLLDYVRQYAEYVNENEPYVYARGIIVQDFIQLDYLGRPVKTENYRGQWSLAIAKGEVEGEPRYMNTDSTYDTVTHRGAVWACQQSGTIVEPSDSVTEWIRKMSYEFAIYELRPSVNIVHYRPETGLSVNFINVVVGIQSEKGDFDIDDQHVLDSYGLRVEWSIDGKGERHILNISPVAAIELEDGSGIIATENGSGLYLEGEELDISKIEDNITLYLMNGDKQEASYIIPVVKDADASFKSIVFLRSNTPPSTPSSDIVEWPMGNNDESGNPIIIKYNSFYNPIPAEIVNGQLVLAWSDGVPEGQEKVWMTSRTFYKDPNKMAESHWSKPSDMTDTSDLETMYSADLNPETLELTIGNEHFSKEGVEINENWLTAANGIGWFDEPSECPSEPKYMAVTKFKNGVWSDFQVSRIQGESVFTSVAFTRSATRPNDPINTADNEGRNTFENPLPSDKKEDGTYIWSATIPDGTDKVWMTTRVFTNIPANQEQYKWSAPQGLTDTADIETMYTAKDPYGAINDISVPFSKNEENEIDEDWITAANAIGWYDEAEQCINEQQVKAAPKYMAVSTAKNGVWSAWQIATTQGEPTVTYTIVADKGTLKVGDTEVGLYIMKSTGTSTQRLELQDLEDPDLGLSIVSSMGDVYPAYGAIVNLDIQKGDVLHIELKEGKVVRAELYIREAGGNDGADGKDGQDGQDGKDGEDGISFDLKFDPIFIEHPIDPETKATIGGATYTAIGTMYKNGVEMSLNGFGITASVDNANGGIAYANISNNKVSLRITIQANVSSRATKATVTITRPSAVPASDVPWSTYTASLPIVYAQRGIVGPMGDNGASYYPQGYWDQETEYEVTRDENGVVIARPIVYYDKNNDGNGTYYVLMKDNGASKDEDPTDSEYNPSVWKPFSSIGYVFTEALMAKWARLAKAVFYGDYMFSAWGVDSNGAFSEYTKDMFTNGKLNGNFTPNIFLDLLHGGAKFNCLSEPFVQMKSSKSLYKIEPSIAHNVSVQYGREDRPAMIFMPKSDSLTDGVNCTVVYQSISMTGAVHEMSGMEWGKDLGNKLVILCADGRMLNTSYETDRSEGFFMVNGIPTRMLFIAPGDVVKLKSVEIVNEKRVWVVENQSDFSIMKSNFYFKEYDKDDVDLFSVVCNNVGWYPQSAESSFASARVMAKAPNNTTPLNYNVYLKGGYVGDSDLEDVYLEYGYLEAYD